MKTLKYFFLVSFIAFQSPASANDDPPFILRSPDRVIEVHISVDSTISWMMTHENDIVIAPSAISMKSCDGTHLGKDAVPVKSETETVNETFVTPIYRKNSVVDRYNQLVYKTLGVR